MSSKDFYDRLKQYKVKGKTDDDLRRIWDETWNEEAADRPDEAKKDAKEFANQVERVFRGKLKRGSDAAIPEGIMCVFGVKVPFDYVEMMRKKCQRQYAEDPEKAQDEGFVTIAKDRFGEEKVVELDYREKYSNGKPNDNFGEKLDNISGWTFNVFATWEPDGKDRRFIWINIGGEGNPETADPTCPKCGKINVFTKKCPECGTENDDYLFPDFVEHRYKPFRTKLYMRVDGESKAETAFWQVPDSDFGEYVKIDNYNPIEYAKTTPGYEVPAEKESKKKTRRVGAFAAYATDSKGLLKWWESHKSGKEKRNETVVPAIVLGQLIRRYGKASKKNEYRLDIDDDKSDFSDSDGKVQHSMRVSAQEHVWIGDVLNKIAEDSMVMVIGPLDRWQQYDFKAKKQIAGKWQDPHIIGIGIVGVPGGVRKPKKVEAVPSEKPAQVQQKLPAKKAAKKTSPPPDNAALFTKRVMVIANASGKTPEEIKEMIDVKVTDLKGLIKKDAAVAIVAKELGVDLDMMVVAGKSKNTQPSPEKTAEDYADEAGSGEESIEEGKTDAEAQPPQNPEEKEWL